MSTTPYYRPQTKFAKVIFLHVSVHSVHGGEYLGRYPPAGTPPWQVYPLAGTPPQQVHPLAGTPPWQIPPRPVHPPAGTPPPGQVHPLAGTPPAGTPWQVHPRAGTPPPREQCMVGDKGNKWAVCILLECILV